MKLLNGMPERKLLRGYIIGIDLAAEGTESVTVIERWVRYNGWVTRLRYIQHDPPILWDVETWLEHEAPIVLVTI